MKEFVVTRIADPTRITVCFVGKSGTGKTTLLEKLIPELKRRGLRVGTVKHHAHPGFEIDREGKDTWRHAKAGSDHVVIAAPDKIASIRTIERALSLAEIVATMSDLDLILVEGFKRSTFPKIEIIREAAGIDPICTREEVIAMVTDVPSPYSVPAFNLDDMKGLADFLEKTFLAQALSAT